MLQWKCPKCGDNLEVPESLALTLVVCPTCGNRSAAPAALTAPLPNTPGPPEPASTPSFHSLLTQMMTIVAWISIIGGVIALLNEQGGGAVALLSGILWLALVEIILRLREIASLLRARTTD